MTNQDFKEKYFAEKGIRWYDNWADYANWLEDALIEALSQPSVMRGNCKCRVGSDKKGFVQMCDKCTVSNLA